MGRISSLSPLSLMNLPTKSEGDESTITAQIKLRNSPPSIAQKSAEMEYKENMKQVILRFDMACEDVLKQLLLHEFAYFKSTLSSRKRLGSIYKKLRRKTSRVLPSNNHSSPKLTALNQLSIKSHSLPRRQLKLTKTKSCNDYLEKTTSLKSRHIAISREHKKRHSVDLSPINATMFSVLNASRPQSARLRSRVPPKTLASPNKSAETLTTSDVITPSTGFSPTLSGGNSNKLTLILEHSGHTNPITPMDVTPIDEVKSVDVDEFRAYARYSDVELADSDNCGDDKVADLEEIYDDVMKEDKVKKDMSELAL